MIAESGCFTSCASEAAISPIVMTRETCASSACVARRAFSASARRALSADSRSARCTAWTIRDILFLNT